MIKWRIGRSEMTSNVIEDVIEAKLALEGEELCIKMRNPNCDWYYVATFTKQGKLILHNTVDVDGLDRNGDLRINTV